MMLHSHPCLVRSRHVAVALAVLLSGLLSSPAQADLLGDLTGENSGCGVTMTCTGPGLPGSTGPSACSANGAGSPCGLSSGPASQSASTTGQNVGAGNPLNVLSGNKYQVEVDLPPLPGVLGLEIVRHYNSQYARPNVASGIFGRGWKLSYETALYAVKNTVQIVQADGTRIIFSRDAKNPSLCATADPARGKVLVRPTPRGEEFIWVWPDGRRLFFDAQKKLTQIVAPTGEFVSLTRDAAGALLKVTDPQGRSLVLSYVAKTEKESFHGVRFIDSPVGRFAYAYGSVLPEGAQAQAKEPGSVALAVSNLVSVTLPSTYAPTEKAHPFANRGTTQSAVTRSYHYESAKHPTLLTGVSVSGTGSDGVPMQVRVASWDYDDQARAILSVKGDRSAAIATAGKETKEATGTPPAGPETVRLAFPAPGTTVLTNSLGQTTTYRWAQIAGELRLLEAIGPGCASCGPTNVRYAYDDTGRLSVSSQLDAQGRPLAATRQQRDAAGRVIREERFRFVKGKAVPAGWVDFAYAAVPAGPSPGASPSSAEPEASTLPDPKPRRVIRPSVVAGKTHEWRYVYNAAGQVLSVTESGFAPALPDEGKRGEPTPIERTTTYTYTTVNGRSLLASIDGPLPNGPKGDPSDSDVSTFTWDQRGDFVVAVVRPGNLKNALTNDEAGRVTQVTDGDGFSSQIEYAATGAIVKLTRITPDGSSPRIHILKYDALGRATETGTVDAENRYRALTHQAFDPAGNRLWRADARGLLEQNRFDSESRLLATGRYSPSLSREQRFTYDTQGRITRIEDNSGSLLALTYDAAGRPESPTDALGRTTSLSGSREAASARADVLPPLTLIDDFGRPIAHKASDSGTTLREFDATGRLLAMRDAAGQRARYVYDVQGRITQRTITDAAGHDTVTAWRYAGRHLVGLEHPGQRERYTYDGRGWRKARIVTLDTPQGQLTAITRYRHDDTGRLLSVGLPDGSALNYRYDGQGQVIAIARNRVQTSWLQWLAPETTLARDIERDLIGLRRYTTGNGVEAIFRCSREGVLAQVLYRDTRTAAPASRVTELFGIAPARAAQEKAAQEQQHPAQPGAFGLPDDPRAIVDQRYLWDRAGNLRFRQDRTAKRTHAAYAYDGRDRLIASVATDQEHRAVNRYAYDGNDRRVLAQEGIADPSDLRTNTRAVPFTPGSHRESAPSSYSTDGLPVADDHRQFTWDAAGRLLEVREEGKSSGRYAYNHRGERIAKSVGEKTTRYLYENRQLQGELDARGRMTRLYLYLADRPVAVVDTPEGAALAEELPAWRQTLGDLATILVGFFGNRETTVWLHADHLGAPVAATGANAHVVWRADYAPFGAAKVVADGFSLNLRRPGQYEDAETGFFYNGQRYYDPQRGSYLSPDPLGTPDGPNPYAYVRHNPLRYVDPDGLILFAFDGTNNSNPPPGVDDFSNVYKFFLAYDVDSQTTNNGDSKWYMNGIGRNDPDSGITTNWWDQYNGNTGHARVNYMLDQLNDYVLDKDVSDGQMISLDIVGFSRGAALARDFANRVATLMQNNSWGSKTACVEIRFMGLWDTVAQFGMNGADNGSWQLAIPAEALHVYQAVAMNENRYLFPGESIGSGVQRGFIGSHADIGGSYGTGDLSDVALNWIVEQAKTSGITMKNWEKIEHSEWGKVTNPVVHDKAAEGEESAFCMRANNESWASDCVPRSSANPGGLTAMQITAEGFIIPRETLGMDADGESYITGDVDMEKYAQWLQNNYGFTVDYEP